MSVYSHDLRQKIIDAHEVGEGSVRVLAARFHVSPTTVQSYVGRWRETQTVAPALRGSGRLPRIRDEQLSRVRRLVISRNDCTLAEYVALYSQRYHVPISKSAFDRALERARITRKKKTLSATEQGTRANRRQRRQFVRDAWGRRTRRFIFLDEFGFNRATGRRYGRARRGRRARGQEPANPDPNLTLIVGLTRNGPLAPVMFPGAMDGSTFVQYIELCLGPWLRHGDVVVWDGLGAHRAAGARQAIENLGGEVLALPSYSPDLNPAEELGSKLKTLARGRPHNSTEQLMAAVGWAYGHVTSSDAQGWFSHRAWYLSVRTKWIREPL